MSVARYRDRHSVAGKKSDHGDSFVLASVLRTDMHVHRPLPADSELAQAIAVLARAQRNAVWDRTTAHNKLRSHLREYYPGFLAAFPGRGGILRPEARAVLAAAPTRPAPRSRPSPSCVPCCAKPGAAAASTPKPPGSARRSAHPQMRQLPLVEQAMGRADPSPAPPARRGLRRGR